MIAKNEYTQNSFDLELYNKKIYKKFFDYLEQLIEQDKISQSKDKLYLTYKIIGETTVIEQTTTEYQRSLCFDNILLPNNLKIFGFQRVIMLNYPTNTLPDDLYIENELDLNSYKNELLSYFGKRTIVGYLKNDYKLKNKKDFVYCHRINEYQEKILTEYADFFDCLNENNKRFNKNEKIDWYFKDSSLIIHMRENTSTLIDVSYHSRDEKIVINNCKIPYNTKFNNFDVEIIDYPEKILPPNLDFDCCLKISEKIAKLESLNNLKVKNLYIEGTKIENFNDVKYIKNNIKLVDVPLKSFKGLNKNKNTELIKIFGSLEYSNKNSVPENLFNDLLINHSLYITNTNLKYLKNITIKEGDFYLENSEIEYLDNVQIHIDLKTRRSKLKKINNVNVRRNIDLNHTQIFDLTGFNGGGNIFYGNLYLNHTVVLNTVTLPDNLVVNGDLDITYSNIEKFGKNTTIKGNIRATRSALKEIPEDLSFNNVAHISFTNITNIPIVFATKERLHFVIDGLLIQNANEYYKQSNFILNFERSFGNKNKELTEKEKITQMLCANILSVQKNLLLNFFDKINEYELEKYIIKNQKNIIKNKIINFFNYKYKQKVKSDIIEFCRTKEAFAFISEKGYKFTKNEYDAIEDVKLKTLYENYLLQQAVNNAVIDLKDKENTNKKVDLNKINRL